MFGVLDLDTQSLTFLQGMCGEEGGVAVFILIYLLRRYPFAPQYNVTSCPGVEAMRRTEISGTFIRIAVFRGTFTHAETFPSNPGGVV